MRWGGIVAMLVMGAFFALLSLGHFLQLEEARVIWAHGKVAEGTVTDRVIRKGKGSDYSYVFRVDGRAIAAERRSVPFWPEIGSRVVVRYDPDDPANNVTEGELASLEDLGNRALLPGITVAMLAWAAYLFVVRRREAKATLSSRPARLPPTSSN